MNDFCDILGMLRHEKGISQRQAASDLGISQALLSHYETGIREPGLAFVKRASKYYDVTCDFLLGIEPTRTNEKDVDKIFMNGNNDSLESVRNLASTEEIILKILKKYGDTELLEYATRYISAANYKLARYLFMLNPKMDLRQPATSQECFSHLASLEMIYSELAFKNKLTKCAKYSKESGYNEKYLTTDFPLLCSHLLELLDETDKRISGHLKENIPN